ncbi:rhamnan synthesis protein F [Lactococcus piscium]|uniref:rhamnan synthesis F family protein n=1 Tax=Pseudolactococcus carnosus TaxID=2749961 RepID=UPI001FBBC340|nr:rhamnan synthesis F family protein [Lactococcus carnosus]MCJ1996245.1 rhamnan synthesis protein F [Lactococcus carnosus]
MKRVAIYFFFDSKGVVHDYVPYFLSDLMKNVDKLIIVVNGQLDEMNEQTLSKFGEVYFRDNDELDVGAYKFGLSKISSELAQFDELILLNNTIMGPLYPFKETFDKMLSEDVDFWGITKVGEIGINDQLLVKSRYDKYYEHIQSHWIAIRKTLFLSLDWEKFWTELPYIADYDTSVGMYETVFTKYFNDLGYKWSVSVDSDAIYPTSNMPIYDLPRQLVEQARCPIFKKRATFNSLERAMIVGSGEQNPELFDFIKTNTDYPISLIGKSVLPYYHYDVIHKNMAKVSIMSKDVPNIPEDKVKVALIIHLYFEDMVDDFFAYANFFPDTTDIFITTSQISVKQKVEKKRSSIRQKMSIIEVSNQGRDVSALLVGAKKVITSGEYDLICFTHDKKTLQLGSETSGYSFAHKCYENIHGSSAYVSNVISLFENNEDLGLAVAPAPNHGDYFWTVEKNWTPDPGNIRNTKKLLDKLGIHVPIAKDHLPIAPIGSVFWFRPDAMKKLFDKDWQLDDFPGEPLPVDGTISHAIERIYPFVAQDAGYYTQTIMNDRYAAIEYLNLSYYLRRITQEVGIFENVSDSGNLLGKLFQINVVKQQLLDYQSQVEMYSTQINELQQIVDNNRWNSSNLLRKVKTVLKKFHV